MGQNTSRASNTNNQPMGLRRCMKAPLDAEEARRARAHRQRQHPPPPPVAMAFLRAGGRILRPCAAEAERQ
ncbi:Os06g0170833 [Oryza sativa Japonica Group]|uniref:Os06g0170833 protein n=1 Tax=Oryza sativa subsp. japonica TaxID=39947 RepID=A0A0P0WSY9_ORYSJ|nr:Os06g0170833 [Oryza sativa Japonica Group]